MWKSRGVVVHVNCPDGNLKRNLTPEHKTITIVTNIECFCGEPVPAHIRLQRKIINGE